MPIEECRVVGIEIVAAFTVPCTVIPDRSMTLSVKGNDLVLFGGEPIVAMGVSHCLKGGGGASIC